jgi:hypothetical protein
MNGEPAETLAVQGYIAFITVLGRSAQRSPMASSTAGAPG